MKSGHLLLLNNILDLIESLEPTVYLPFYTDAFHKLLGIFLTIISVSILFYNVNHNIDFDWVLVKYVIHLTKINHMTLHMVLFIIFLLKAM